MSFQKKAYINQALGKAGNVSRDNPLTKLPMIAEGDAVVAGGFCYEGTDTEHQVLGVKSGATSVAGFVVFPRYQVAVANFANTMKINEGEEVAVVKKGYCFAVSSTAAVKGNNVVVKPADGTIQTLALTYATKADTSSGVVTTTASNMPEGFIDTGWKVETGAEAGATCEIYNI